MSRISFIFAYLFRVKRVSFFLYLDKIGREKDPIFDIKIKLHSFKGSVLISSFLYEIIDLVSIYLSFDTKPLANRRNLARIQHKRDTLEYSPDPRYVTLLDVTVAGVMYVV